ncbi:Ms4527A family Cys-rich leader peptide [Skermania sp. ID1734]
MSRMTALRRLPAMPLGATDVRLVARRHVDLKRVCSCCCLPSLAR